MPSAALTYVNASADAAGVRTLVTDAKSEVGRGWWFALLLAVIVSEFFLATWGGRRKKAAEDSSGVERVDQTRAGSWIAGIAGARRLT